MFKTNLTLDRLFVIAVLCMLTCCDTGGCLEGGNCTHPWDTLPGSCAMTTPQPPGAIGGHCYSVGSFSGVLCDNGARCDDDVCIPCGGAGGTCCDDGNGNGLCLGGATCAQGGDFGICDATCGTLTPGTDTCCAGNSCGPGAECLANTGKCVAAGTSLCSDQTQLVTQVVFQDARKCATTTATFRAKPSDLAGCISSFQMDHGFAGHCLAGDFVVPDNFCPSGWGGGQIAEICSSESPADITECEKETCNDCVIAADDSCT